MRGLTSVISCFGQLLKLLAIQSIVFVQHWLRMRNAKGSLRLDDRIDERGRISRVVDRRIGMCCGSTVDSGGGCKVVGPGEESMISLL